MATVAYTVPTTTRAGVAVTMATPNGTGDGNGDTWDNTGEDCIVIVQTGATDVQPTFKMVDTIDGETIADSTNGKLAGAVGTNATKAYGPFPNYPYGDADNIVEIIWDAVTDATFAVIRMGSLELT